eukprot:5165640-Ditylum_brightwellii.AAC.1
MDNCGLHTKAIKKDVSIMVVPTDKTNNYVTVHIEKCNSWVLGHLSKNEEELHWKEIIDIHQKAEVFAAKLKSQLAKGEMEFLNEGIASKAILQLQLLVKDHEDTEENGDYPTQLVMPATIFTAIFLKIGYLGIKRVLDNNK